MDTIYNQVHIDTIKVLNAIGYHVYVPSTNCCGALASHSGEHDVGSGQELTIAADVENINFTGQYQGGDYATTLAMGEEDDGIFPPPVNPGPPGPPSDGGSSNIPTINLRDLFGNG